MEPLEAGMLVMSGDLGMYRIVKIGALATERRWHKQLATQNYYLTKVVELVRMARDKEGVIKEEGESFFVELRVAESRYKWLDGQVRRWLEPLTQLGDFFERRVSNRSFQNLEARSEEDSCEEKK